MSVNGVIFECAACGHAITRPVALLPPDQPVKLEDGEPAVPEGYFALSDDEYWTGSAGCPLINLKDLIGTRHHPDGRRLSGCCGPDGCDGPNLVCACGREVGTEKSDCWMAHAAVLLPDAVRKHVDQ